MKEPHKIVLDYVNKKDQNPSCRIQNERNKNEKYPLDKIMEDEDFNELLLKLTEELYKFGLKNLRQWNYRTFNKYSQECFLKDFDKLKKYTLEGYRISSTTRIGQKCMDYYTMYLIDNVKNYKGISFQGQFTPENIKYALKKNRTQHSSTYVTEILRTLPCVGGNGFSVTAYKPTLTKAICDYYKATNVLDTCVGWGGRMIGAVASGAKYTGIEPATETFAALKHICGDLKINNSVTLHNGAAETILPTLEGKFDLVITSPPYFNLEIYTDEESQSYKQTQTWEEWVDNYLTPWVYGALNLLDSNGVSCWSVKNFKSNKEYDLKDKVVELHKNKGWNIQNEIFYIGKKKGSTKNYDSMDLPALLKKCRALNLDYKSVANNKESLVALLDTAPAPRSEETFIFKKT